ncbi:MAG: hypothetical protein IPI38_11895 [Gemmatimonadetes bacterium]|nr:hypothetical protein [Gemmatimonadota bacterium]
MRQRLRAQEQLGLGVLAQHLEVGVGALELVAKHLRHVVRGEAHEAPLAGREAEHQHLVILDAVDLEGAAVGAIGDDRAEQVAQREGPVQAGRVDRD